MMGNSKALSKLKTSFAKEFPSSSYPGNIKQMSDASLSIHHKHCAFVKNCRK